MDSQVQIWNSEPLSVLGRNSGFRGRSASSLPAWRVSSILHTPTIHCAPHPQRPDLCLLWK